MNREMYEKCLNKEMVIFGKLPKDVREAIKSADYICYLNFSMQWVNITKKELLRFSDGCVYRINPATPIYDAFEEIEVTIESFKYCFDNWYLHASLTMSNCLGIIYELNGVETLRTSVDLAFGTPKRVRFRKV